MEIRADATEIVHADAILRAAMFELTDRGRRLEVMKEAGNLLVAMVRNRIHKKKYDPDGRPWRPWSPRYRAPKHGGHTLLKLTGAMANRTRRTRGIKRISVGTSVIYGAVHQFGHTFTNAFGRGIKVRVPARPYLGWGPEERNAVDSDFQTFLEDAWSWR